MSEGYVGPWAPLHDQVLTLFETGVDAPGLGAYLNLSIGNAAVANSGQSSTPHGDGNIK